MHYSKISDQATDVASTVASNVSGVVGEAVSTGIDRGRDLVTTAKDRLPDSSTATDWTRQHVPGLTPPKRRKTSWLPVLTAVGVLALLVWWFRRESEAGRDSASQSHG